MITKALRLGFAAFEKANPLPGYVRSAVRLMLMCRTAALGGHVESCPDGHFHRVWYNSCGHRFCPKCAFLRIEKWLLGWKSRLLATDHYHVIFTIPEELNGLWLCNVRLMASLLFWALSRTLLELLSDEKYLGVLPGIIATLHTWGRILVLHPHIHCLITGGGLTNNGKWKVVNNGYLIPIRVVMPVFRGKFIYAVRKALRDGNLTLPSGMRSQQLENLLNKLGRKKWNVHIRQRCPGGTRVLVYLGRYISGGPISKSRLIEVTEDRVLFRYADNKDLDEDKRPINKVMSLSLSDFIRRLLLHVPVPGLQYVRSYGIYANTKRPELAQCREQLGQDSLEGPEPLGWENALAKVSEKHPERCPICGKQLVYSGVIPRKRQGESASFRDFGKLIQPVGMPVAA